MAKVAIQLLFLYHLDTTLQSKPMEGFGSSLQVPDHFTIGSENNSDFDVRVRTDPQNPLTVKSAP